MKTRSIPAAEPGRCCLTASRGRISGLVPGLVFILALSSALCVRPAAAQTPNSAKPEVVVCNGREILRFDTPEEQLRYARGWLADPAEKRAALTVLLDHFDEPVAIRAQAELELAYLELGSDYRTAGRKACEKAIAQYNRIIKYYTGHPSVCAKAHWHLGWIYADLLRRPEQGLVHYRIITARYADAQMRLEPPVPWVSLVLPQITEKTPAVYERPTYAWAAMALLEIVRHSRDTTERVRALETVMVSHGESLAAAYALRLALTQPDPLGRKAARYAERLLAGARLNQPLKTDIAKGLAAYRTRPAKETAP